MKQLIATAAFTATLCACGPMHVCTPTETRCAGSFVEVCDAEQAGNRGVFVRGFDFDAPGSDFDDDRSFRHHFSRNG